MMIATRDKIPPTSSHSVSAGSSCGCGGGRDGGCKGFIAEPGRRRNLFRKRHEREPRIKRGVIVDMMGNENQNLTRKDPVGAVKTGIGSGTKSRQRNIARSCIDNVGEGESTDEMEKDQKTEVDDVCVDDQTSPRLLQTTGDVSARNRDSELKDQLEGERQRENIERWERRIPGSGKVLFCWYFLVS